MAFLLVNIIITTSLWVQALGWEDPPEEAWQHTPVFFPGESPQTEEPGGLQSMGLQNWT